jgi:hypothetical protein
MTHFIGLLLTSEKIGTGISEFDFFLSVFAFGDLCVCNLVIDFVLFILNRHVYCQKIWLGPRVQCLAKFTRSS